MEESYRKDLSHITWDEVYARQEKRAELTAFCLDELGLRPGDRVLDIGPGPGYVSLQAAKRVGPNGVVYAIDRSAEALDYLERLQHINGIAQIKRIVADAAAMEPLSEPVDAALVTMVLHHTDDPAGLLRNVAHCLPPGTRVVVAEFHPDGHGLQGPPAEERLAPEVVRRWCEEAGLTTLTYVRQSSECYVFTGQRT